ncbi:MAG: PadR family transcriptional regulator [Alphaproteobacteria bacterium]|nr:PadR family transcriptional regulator [Alphaproteobacteria bacterium]
MNVATLCLGILALGDASGYEIKKRFDGPLKRIQQPSFGSIYPALTELTREGLVSCTVHAQEKRPDKKVYSITPAGRAHLKAALQESLPAPDRIHSDFLATMLFSDMLSPDFVARAVKDRIAFYRDMVDHTQCEHPSDAYSGGRAFVHGYARAVCSAAIAYLEAHAAETRQAAEDLRERRSSDATHATQPGDSAP